MTSIIPAVVALLFLIFGGYVVHQKGLNRVTTAFLILCITTFFWQFVWAILFQTQDANFALMLIKLGWLLILFLPTSLFHFLVEITGRRDLLKVVNFSYLFCIFLAALHVTTNWVVDGFYTNSWGFYPKAGYLHFLHVAQTTYVVIYGLTISYNKMKMVQGAEHTKLALCSLALLIYSLSAVDYLCNYGLSFYPPGVIFITIGLGLIAYATAKYQAMNDSRMLAAGLAHEMRTPLATLNIQSQILRDFLPDLVEGYRKAEAAGLIESPIDENAIDGLLDTARLLEKEVKSANHAVDMMLALTTADYLNEKDFQPFSMKECVEVAISRSPQSSRAKEIILLHVKSDFIVLASREFLIFVIINLINNSFDALRSNPKGRIRISIISDQASNRLEFLDDGEGIEGDVLPHIFDRFFTTKKRGENSGVGLAFCKNVMESFGGKIDCKSERGKFTQFTLTFKQST